ncbi:glycosyltransferase family 2 protein [Plectonema cf. radiosum LEGE 06105]|uniref:Glycosyltransferase family 2 protein n=1 Tax=Plectonema cf. radiosum LEGE 06105 TaxID=945769 RepID=A0A8J7F101_9CYAN|nr:glycosyltransferase family 2 protein [Plectonema radiosum]MBE9212595.1 glycosyltransferase family 2 protein [Plectonema cf. radiosum LEGE 06105]
MHTPTQVSISVIIPVHNGGDSFRLCLSSLKESTIYPDEIIVVSDADTDGSWLVAEEFGAKVIRMAVNAGPAKARNLGASVATGDILYFVDADVVISQDAISQVKKAFENESDLAALIGSYDDEPGASNFLSQYKNLFHHYTHQIASQEAFTFWGACGAIRREIFLSLSGFNESYRRPSIEDIELGYRIRRGGYKIKLVKDLQVKHLKRWGVVSLLKAEIFYRALPWTELILRQRQLDNDLNLGVSSRLSVVLIYAILATLVAAWWWSGFLAVTALLSLIMLWLNFAVYRFFHDKRGLGFALRVIPWHWFYYIYGGLAFAVGTTNYLWHQWFLSKLDISTA